MATPDGNLKWRPWGQGAVIFWKMMKPSNRGRVFENIIFIKLLEFSKLFADFTRSTARWSNNRV